jgi:hypothetical protein
MQNRGLQYVYRGDILEQLLAHGVRPKATTPPALVHEFVSDLYRYEIRRLRARLLRKDFARGEYADRVVELRRRYPLISLDARWWVKGKQ